MMNRHLFLGLGAAVALFATACNADKLTEVNENPNDPTDAPSGALFTNAARNGVGRWLDGVGGTRYAFLSQHLAEVQYPESDQYRRLTASTTTGLFNGSYNVELQDLELIQRRGEAASQSGLWGPALVLKMWEFGILTDVFGDIPYTQAFRADSAVLSPVYDSQLSIYTDMFAKLTTSSTALGTATNVLGTSDPIYAGDPASWRRFANSLRLRHALRLYTNPASAAAANSAMQAALADAGGLITSNAQNARMTWPGDGIYDNPWAANFKGRDDHRISNRLLTHLRDNQDPRLPIYAMPAETDIAEIAGRTLRYCPTGAPPCYVGLFNALTHAQASPLIPNTSRPGAIFYPGATAYGTFGGGGSSYPSYLMTAAEVEFIRAEAAERGIGQAANSAAAAAFYNAGITRSMEQFGVGAAAIATYLARPTVVYTPGTAGLRQIAIQKWLALYTDGIQAWTEVRRTCQPANVEPGPSATTANLPRRLFYSTTERTVNAANVAAAVAAQGADNFTTSVYWDKSALASRPTFEAGCSTR